MKLISKQKQLVLILISLLCIIISFGAGVFYNGPMLIYIEYISIVMALIILAYIIINKRLAKNND